MKKIAWFVMLAYLSIFLLLTWPLITGAFFGSGMDATEPLSVFRTVSYWMLIGILLLCEAGLLFLPVKIERRRPIARRHVILPIIVSGFLSGALLTGIIYSLSEFFTKDACFDSGVVGWAGLASWLVMWVVWGVIFGRMAKNKESKSNVLLQCRRLVQGGLIALLVAVPTHIVARCRDYCCAGFYTFIGITFGIAVMLLAFGPGIYFLYAARWRRLHPVGRLRVGDDIRTGNGGPPE